MHIRTFLLAAVSPFILVPSAAAAAEPFLDVSPSHPNAAAILYAREYGIVKGYEDNSYRPSTVINRAEFTHILVTAFIRENERQPCPAGVELFSDTRTAGDKPDWFAASLCAAKAKKWVDGYPDGTFKPSRNVTFAEAAKMLTGAMGLTEGMDAIAKTSAWYKVPVFVLSAYHAIPTDVLSLQQPVTRGQIAEILYRVIQNNKFHPAAKDYGYPVVVQAFTPFESSSFEALAQMPAVFAEELPSSGKQYVVLLGMFTDRAAAQTKAREAQGWMLETSLTTLLPKNQFAVVFGPFRSEADAQARVDWNAKNNLPLSGYAIKDVGSLLWPAGNPFNEYAKAPAGLLQSLVGGSDLALMRQGTLNVRWYPQGCAGSPAYVVMLEKKDAYGYGYQVLQDTGEVTWGKRCAE